MVPLPTARDTARIAGIILGAVGLLFFVLAVCGLVCGPGPEADGGTRIADIFRYSGIYVTISWLLLRFAAGQFPFGGLRRSPPEAMPEARP